MAGLQNVRRRSIEKLLHLEYSDTPHQTLEPLISFHLPLRRSRDDHDIPTKRASQPLYPLEKKRSFTTEDVENGRNNRFAGVKDALNYARRVIGETADKLVNRTTTASSPQPPHSAQIMRSQSTMYSGKEHRTTALRSAASEPYIPQADLTTEPDAVAKDQQNDDDGDDEDTVTRKLRERRERIQRLSKPDPLEEKLSFHRSDAVEHLLSPTARLSLLGKQLSTVSPAHSSPAEQPSKLSVSVEVTHRLQPMKSTSRSKLHGHSSPLHRQASTSTIRR